MAIVGLLVELKDVVQVLEVVKGLGQLELGGFFGFDGRQEKLDGDEQEEQRSEEERCKLAGGDEHGAAGVESALPGGGVLVRLGLGLDDHAGDV